MEMQCYCEKNHKSGIYSGACPNSKDYVHHRDWGREEDYMCSECIENCCEE